MRATTGWAGIWLDGGDGAAWRDNLIDLLPDDDVTIQANGLGNRELRVTWLGRDW
ncbi:MAG: hypothetical protein R2867_40645 [Caldilineaceae bacterium]